MPLDRQRWYAVKIFERDEKVIKQLGLSEETLSHIEDDIVTVEKRKDDDAEAIIINERYLYIEGIMKRCYEKKSLDRMKLSDKIDRIVTNRWLAIPIFAVAMWLVYFLSIGSVGDFTVVFMNDGLFGSFSEAAAAGDLPSWMGS